jgi:hypothetical protein
VNVASYLIDWDKKSRSIFQYNVKQFLKEFWSNKVVCEEFYLPGSKMSLDIVNLTDKIAIECQGKQHLEYNKYFHDNSTINYLNQIKRDFSKYEWCQLNGIELVEINQGEEINLTKEWFLEKYDINL